MLQFLCFVVFLSTAFADSEPQREYILFEKADLDLSGELNQTEFDIILEKFDLNHDNQVDIKEFVKSWVDVSQLGPAVEATALFDAADYNDDGVLEHSDLVEFFKYFDMDHDGGVDLNEFLTQWGELELVPEPAHHDTTTKKNDGVDGVLG